MIMIKINGIEYDNVSSVTPSPIYDFYYDVKTMDGKIYLSVRNPVTKNPVMADGLPVSNRKGHGYGTQSIQYVTEKLGGNCQFSAKNKIFIARVII